MTFAQRRNRLTTHFSEHILVVKKHISVITKHESQLQSTKQAIAASLNVTSTH